MQVSDAVSDLSDSLAASGSVLWLWDSMQRNLYPAIVHGYGGDRLAQLPRVDPKADNAIAAAFSSGQTRVVNGTRGLTGAIATPLLTPTTCAGVLALEFPHGGEQDDHIRAVIAIIAAQLSTSILLAALSPVVTDLTA